MMNQFVAFIKLIRLPNLLIIALTQYAIRYGIINTILTHSIYSGIDLKLLLSNLDFFLLSLSTVLIAAAGYIINDYFDVKIDRVNRPDKIIVGKYIKRRVVMGAHIVLNIFAVIIGAYLAYKVGSYKLVTIQILSTGALWYYSISFKKQVLLGNIIVAALAALVPLVAGLYDVVLFLKDADNIVNNLLFQIDINVTFNEVMSAYYSMMLSLTKWILGFALFAFLSTMVREIIKDIEDYDGDKKYYCRTLPVQYGKDKAKIVAQIIAIVMIILISYYQFEQFKTSNEHAKAFITIMYLFFTVQLPLIYVVFKLRNATEKIEFTRLSFYMKIIMLSGVLYTVLFWYSITYL